MIMESDMRKKEAEEKAIAEIAGSSENNISKGKTWLPGGYHHIPAWIHLILWPIKHIFWNLIFLDPKKRKRRWGDENDKVLLQAPVLLPTPGVLPSGSLKNVGRSNPELIQYAIRVFGTTDLTESQWKQCEDQIKVKCLYRYIMQIRRGIQIIIFEEIIISNKLIYHLLNHFQMSMVYNEMLNKKKQAEKLAQMGKNKYEYDSDEDTEVSH